ncbi:MAG: hypothetical protein ACKVOU_01435 [Cytophagales bacterium]
MFDFTAIKIFEKYNFSREDAEALVETIKEAKSGENATKSDLLDLRTELKYEIKKIEERILMIERDIRNLDVKIESVKNQLIVWVFTINFTVAGLIIAVIKLT